jgi:hypothetical protein
VPVVDSICSAVPPPVSQSKPRLHTNPTSAIAANRTGPEHVTIGHRCRRAVVRADAKTNYWSAV